MDSEFSAMIKAARRAKGWTKEDLAHRANLPLDTIAAAEKGLPLLDAQRKLLCEALSVAYTPSRIASAVVKNATVPYRGLVSFREDDAALFFGRERFTKRILKKLDQSSVVGVIGASGSGKSSIISAGVVPALKERNRVRLASIRPGRRPMAGLTAAVADLIIDSERINALAQLANNLASNPALIAQEIQKRCTGELVVLFIDQFEELFAQTDSVEERGLFLRFIEELANAGSVQAWQSRVLFSVRSDFYQQLMADSRFAELCQDQLVTLSQMSAEELRDAVVKPAESTSRRVEPALVEAIISDAGDEPGNMPLVSFCLSEVWAKCEGPTLTLDAYHRMGGLNGAIASQAEQVYQRLDESQQHAARRLMSRLVRIEEDTRSSVGETRRKLRYDSLASNDQESKVAQQLIASRLAITDYDLVENAQTIELAHEAVIKHWKRLGDWLLEDRAFLVWQQRVEASAVVWEQEGKQKGAVLRGTLLADGQHWMAAGRGADMKPLVREFYAQSQSIFEEETRTRFEGLLRTLLGAEPGNVTNLIAEIRAAFSGVAQQIAEYFLHENRADRSAWKLRLLRVRDDISQAEYIVEHLKACDPAELPPIVVALKEIKDIISEPLKGLLSDGHLGLGTKLRVACAYANVDPHDEIWTTVAQQLAEGLISENPLHLLVFTRCLSPVADYLFDAIQAIMSATDRPTAVRDNATLVLLELAARDPEKIAAILTNCTDQVLEFVFEAAQGKADRDAIAARLKEVVLTSNGSPATEKEILEQGRRRASAAIVLAKMGSLRDALLVLNGERKPDSASQFVFRAKRLRVDSGALAEELVRADAPERIYWLSLAVGEYGATDFTPVTRNAVVRETQRRYREHPAAAVHSVSAWLLRALGQQSFVDAAESDLLTLGQGRDREWFHVRGPNGPMTFAKIPAGEFRMGAPEDEAGYKHYEGPAHTRIVDTSFSACVREVTVGEYAAFVHATGNPPLQNIAEFSSDESHPAIALTWSEARHFCEWLGMWVKENKGENLVFGLPSEVEWEYCARAGTETAFSYGSDKALLDKFAWFESNSGFKAHPAGILRPNQFGLYNMHGNCWEWCEDTYALYAGSKAQPFDARAVGASDALRTLRGGCWNLHWRYSRSACRNWHAPTNRNYYTGMRVFCRS